MTEEAVFVGIDVSKAQLDIAKRRHVVLVGTVPRTCQSDLANPTESRGSELPVPEPPSLCQNPPFILAPTLPTPHRSPGG